MNRCRKAICQDDRWEKKNISADTKNSVSIFILMKDRQLKEENDSLRPCTERIKNCKLCDQGSQCQTFSSPVNLTCHRVMLA